VASGVVEQPSQDAESEQKKIPGAGARRSQHVQRLLDAENLPTFLNHLLTQQAIMVAGAEAAAFLIEGGAETFSLRPIAHIREDNSDSETRAAALNAFQELIRPCVEQGKDGVLEVGPANGSAEAQFLLITLLRSDANIVAVSGVITRCLNLERARQRLQSMQLVAGYFELFTLRRTAEQSRMIAESHQHAMQLSSAVAVAEGFESAAMGLCNELATRSGATRVSLGWVKANKTIKIRALSHTEEFDKKQELIVMLQKVMEECYDQEQVVQYIPGGQSSDNVTRAAQALSRSQGGHSVISIPLHQRSEIVGIVTLEFLPGQQLNPNISRGLTVAVDLLAPQLYDRHENDRWLITKAALSTRHGAEFVFGKQHTLAKLITVAVIGLLAFVWFFKPMYHVSAPFEFASIQPDSVVSPFEGRIESVKTIVDPISGITRKIKPGDKVTKGDVLVRLDTKELRIKRNESVGQASAKDRESKMYAAQVADPHADEQLLAKSQVAADERDHYLAEVAFYDYEIAQADIKAPRTGIILKGDLEDKLNAPVKQGDEMFQIGDPNNLRIELSVEDRDIQDIHERQHGKIATNALPNEKFDFVVDRIVPVGAPKEGSNVFTVYGTVTGERSDAWLPGMAGEARVDVAPKRLAWIWTHRLIDFVRLKLWM